jgi:hypothetical protein
MATKKTELATYYKRLAALDLERKKVLQEIKSHPAYATSYLEEAISNIAKRGNWFIANTPKGETMPIDRKDKIYRIIGGTVERQISNVKRINDTLYHVKLDIELLTGARTSRQLTVSVDRPVDAQLLQSGTQLTDRELTKIKKEIAQFEKEREKQDKITDLENQMKLIQAEIAKLKK